MILVLCTRFPTVFSVIMCCAQEVGPILLLSNKHNSFLLYFPWRSNEKPELAGLVLLGFFPTIKYKTPHNIFCISSGVLYSNCNCIFCTEAQQERKTCIIFLNKSQNHLGWKKPRISPSQTINVTLTSPPLNHVPKTYV